MPYALTSIGIILFFLMYFGETELWFPIFFITLVASLIYYGMKNRDTGGGWWPRRRKGDDPRPVGPGPLPTSWNPPDVIPDWMIEEADIRPALVNGRDQDDPKESS